MAGGKSGHVPYRTCVICGKKSPKRELSRIVARSDGSVGFDENGREQGRGAYVCADRSCFHLEIKRGRLERALRLKINNQDWTKLQGAIETLAEGKVPQP